MGVLALVGTRKGLFRLEGDDDRREWQVEGPLLDAWGVYHAIFDLRTGVIHAAANHNTYGPTVQRSTDGGTTWQRSAQLRLPERSGLLVNAVWHIQPGLPEQPETLYLGGDPAVLFRSSDGGESWEANRGILEHPTRAAWLPTAGGLFCHSIQVDPRDSRRVYVAISGGGAFRTDDGGVTWVPRNKGVVSDFLRSPDLEVRTACTNCSFTPLNQTAVAAEPLRRVPLGRPWRVMGSTQTGTGLPSDFGYPGNAGPQATRI